jgi:mannosyl-oligosaccharide alpha-1,3-glucosidase
LTYTIDPHIYIDDAYFFYKGNKDRGFFIKNKEDSCCPGMSSYEDFFNPEARRYYADEYLLENSPQNSIGTGIWI